MWDWLVGNYSPAALWTAWGAVILGYFAFAVIERLIPANRHPRRAELAADIRANLVFIVLNPLALLFGGWLSSLVTVRLGGPLLRVELGPVATNPLTEFLSALAPFFVFDFFYYWFHRFQHSWPWLWDVHRLHHSEHFLNVTTNYRHHWLEEFFRAFLIFLPMNFLITISPAYSALAVFLIRQWSSFFHANIRVGLGPATPIVTGPQYHRIHHSVESKHIGKNYAAFFPVWDVMFRTYWKPERGEWPETGLLDTNGLGGYRELLFSPLVAWRRRIESLAK